MNRFLAGAAVFAVLVLAGTASADRTSTARTGGPRDSGSRPDITVPYLSNAGSMYVGNGVAPAVLGKPGVGGNPDLQVKPVFNLIYYGSSLNNNNSFGGAMPRQPNQLRPGK